MKGPLTCVVFYVAIATTVRAADSLDEWLSSLKDQRAGVSYRAAYSPPFDQVSEVTVKRLLSAIKDDDPMVRQSVCFALGELAALPELTRLRGDMAKALIECLEDSYPAVRNRATFALTRCGEPAVELLLAALNKRDIIVQRQGRLGIQMASLPAAGESREHSEVIVVRGVVAASPAQKAGIRQNDQIVSVNGVGYLNIPRVQALIRSAEPGTPITLTVRRGDSTMTMIAVVGVGPLFGDTQTLDALDHDEGFQADPVKLSDYAAVALAMLDIEQIPVPDSTLRSRNVVERGYARYIAFSRKMHVELVLDLLRDEETVREGVKGLELVGDAAEKILPTILADLNLSEYLLDDVVSAMGASAVPALVHELRFGDPERQRKAAALLHSLGETANTATPHLRRLLDTEDTAVAVFAAQALAGQGLADDRVLQALIRSFNSEDYEVRHAGLNGLGILGRDAASASPAVLAAMEGWSQDEFRVRDGVDVLRHIWDLPGAGQALRHHNAAVRGAAAECLGSFGTRAREYSSQLTSLARTDQATEVRTAAIRALALVAGGRETTGVLLDLLNDPVQEVRWSCLEAMGDVRPVERRIIERLISSLDEQDAVLPSLEGLFRLRAEANPAVPKLVALVSSEEFNISLGAIRTLGAIGPAAADAVPILGKNTDRPYALRSLVQIGSAALPALREGLKKTAAPWERELLVEAIGELGEAAQPAIPDLVALLIDHDPVLLETVAESLQRIAPSSPETQRAVTRLLLDRRLDVRAAGARCGLTVEMPTDDRAALMAAALNDEILDREIDAQLDVVYLQTGRWRDKDGAAVKGGAFYQRGSTPFSAGASDMFRYEYAALVREAMFLVQAVQEAGPAQSDGPGPNAQPWAPRLWPPPPGFNTRDTFNVRDVFPSENKLGEIFDKVKGALRTAGFEEIGVFSTLDKGFVVVTRPELVREDGSSYVASDDRWSNLRWSLRPPRASSLSEYFRYLFFGRPGTHRLFLVAITSQLRLGGGQELSPDEMVELYGQGVAALPYKVREWPAGDHMHVLVYQFERRLGGNWLCCAVGAPCRMNLPLSRHLELARIRLSRNVP
jgi:HEAT repeat protein